MHEYTHIDPVELQKLRRPLRDVTKRIWTEENIEIYQDDFGYITKVWSQNGKEYKQNVNGIIVETQELNLYFVAKKISKIIRTNGNRTLATMTNYYARPSDKFIPRNYQFWMPEGCPNSKFIYKDENGSEREVDILEIWFDSLIQKFSTPHEDWR